MGEKLLNCLFAFLIVLAIWELVSRYGLVSSIFLPSPIEVLKSVPENYPAVLSNLLTTLQHVLIGYSLGVFLGILLGAISGWYIFFGGLLEPIVHSLYSIPKITFIPLFILWFGFNEKPIIVCIMLSAFFPVYLNTVSGVKKANKKWVEMVINLGANKLEILKKIIFPASLPFITSGMGIAIGKSITTAIAAEMILGLVGLGGLIYMAGELFKPEIIIFSQIILAIIGMIFYSIFNVFEEKYIFKWLPKEKYKINKYETGLG